MPQRRGRLAVSLRGLIVPGVTPDRCDIISVVATHRPDVSPSTKAALRAEAGEKCANPGCPVTRTHLHHIHEWAVYQSHDAGHMIAVCPTCHDAIHHGQVAISDEKLRRWKSIPRETTNRGHLYVEPGPRAAKLRLGSIALVGEAGLIAFELSPSNRLSFKVVDDDIVLLSLRIADGRGNEVVRLVDGHVKVSDSEVEYGQVPGHHVVTAALKPRYMPGWAQKLVRSHEPSFAADERVTLLNLEVVEPNVVQVQGVWLEGFQGVVATPACVYFLNQPTIIGMAGYVAEDDDDKGETVLHYVGAITTALFGFGDGGALDVTGQRGQKPPPYV